ncbi:MAG: outer membrane lipoprotein-sorting protein [Sphingopyxis sp.]|nr:outer membrane lipoprotein-sorting protein [Sphingopyxis sp.]
MTIINRRNCLLAAAGTLLAFYLQDLAAHTSPPSASTIMQRNYVATRVQDSQAQTVFRLIGKNGKVREQVATTMTRRNDAGGISRMARFVRPADVKGTAVLTVENPKGNDDIWVYLPALGNVRRLQANNKRDAYMGTDLSYGDVIGHAPDAWKHRMTGRQLQSGAECWVIESVPASPAVVATSGYGKRVSWIRIDNDMMVRAELYDSSGRLMKRISQDHITRVSASPLRWQAMRIAVENARTGHRTDVLISSYQANKGLKPDLFLPRALESAR